MREDEGGKPPTTLEYIIGGVGEGGIKLYSPRSFYLALRLQQGGGLAALGLIVGRRPCCAIGCIPFRDS